MRDASEIADEALIAALSFEIELNVRCVESRQGLTFFVKQAADSDERRGPAQIAHDRDDAIALLQRLDELKRLFRSQVVSLVALRVGLEEKFLVRRVVGLRHTTSTLELQFQTGLNESPVKSTDGQQIVRRQR